MPSLASEIPLKIFVKDFNTHAPEVFFPKNIEGQIEEQIEGQIAENSPFGAEIANVSFVDRDPCWLNRMADISWGLNPDFANITHIYEIYPKF